MPELLVDIAERTVVPITALPNRVRAHRARTPSPFRAARL
jgi:hypothetical protein